MPENTAIWILSATIFLPTLVAILLALVPKGNDDLLKILTLATTVAVLGLTIFVMVNFSTDTPYMQSSFNLEWIPSFDIGYYMGIDGISLPLVVLTSFVTVLAMLASWTITKQVKAYCMLFLVLETGMLGVFMALDFFLFYVFWEVMLLPMYFLIGIWGGPRKEYAAIKFFLYTLFGSVLMLIAILMLYFNSDLMELKSVYNINVAAANVEEITGEEIAAVQEGFSSNHILLTAGEAEKILKAELTGEEVHTFNLLALAAIGQKTELFSAIEYETTVDGESVTKSMPFGWSLQHWAFILLLIGFVIKVPSVPVHTWLPDAHVEAPTPISMILAGVLLKMGGYGIIRICYPICPEAGYDFAFFVCCLGVVSMVYGALAALAQTDFKRMVAYSSVSHMGYVVLGLGVWSATPGTTFETASWLMGVKGAMFQMIGHGVSSAGMFFMVGIVYERVHHRNLNEFGGLYGKMPVYTALAMVIFFAGLGLPGLCGFIGEVFVVLSVWEYSTVLAVISASVVVLTAAYILWAIQRVYLGAEYKGPHGESLTPITAREGFVSVTLCVFAVLFGVYPRLVLDYMDPTIDAQVETLADWTNEVKLPKLRAAMESKVKSEDVDQARSDEDKPATSENLTSVEFELPNASDRSEPAPPNVIDRLKTVKDSKQQLAVSN